MKKQMIIPAFAMALSFAPPALAQEQGDASAGLAYARANCANCHAVEKGEDISPLMEATPFEQAANVPGMSAMALAVWFQSPHPNMPNLVLKHEDMHNVIAWITSLKRKPE